MVYLPPWKMMEFVRLDHHPNIPTIGENKIHVPNHQPDFVVWLDIFNPPNRNVNFGSSPGMDHQLQTRRGKLRHWHSSHSSSPQGLNATQSLHSLLQGTRDQVIQVIGSTKKQRFFESMNNTSKWHLEWPRQESVDFLGIVGGTKNKSDEMWSKTLRGGWFIIYVHLCFSWLPHDICRWQTQTNTV